MAIWHINSTKPQCLKEPTELKLQLAQVLLLLWTHQQTSALSALQATQSMTLDSVNVSQHARLKDLFLTWRLVNVHTTQLVLLAFTGIMSPINARSLWEALLVVLWSYLIGTHPYWHVNFAPIKSHFSIFILELAEPVLQIRSMTLSIVFATVKPCITMCHVKMVLLSTLLPANVRSSTTPM